MPIILAPRPLAEQETKDTTKSVTEQVDDLPLKLASTEITNVVPERETDGRVDEELVEAKEEEASVGEKMPKLMTNTVYDI